jgi:hypothetical protein
MHYKLNKKPPWLVLINYWKISALFSIPDSKHSWVCGLVSTSLRANVIKAEELYEEKH